MFEDPTQQPTQPSKAIRIEGDNLSQQGPSPDVQALIGDLQSKREAMMAQGQQQSQDFANMSKQLEALTSLMAKNTNDGKEKSPQASWDSMGRDDVHRVLASEFAKIGGSAEAEDGSEVTTNIDANIAAKAIRELIQKGIDEGIGAYSKTVDAREGATAAVTSVRSELVDMYGANLNKGQPLHSKAFEIYGALQQRYGAEAVSASPEYERIAVLQAAAELGVSSSTARQAMSPHATSLNPPVPGQGSYSSSAPAGGVNQQARSALQAGDLDRYSQALAAEMFSGE